MVEILILSKITLCKLLVIVRVFILLSVCGYHADSTKSTVCESLSDNSFDKVCKDIKTLLGFGTFSEWLFFKAVAVGMLGLVNLDILFSYYFVCALACICSFININTTARGNGVEFGIYVFITRDFFNNTK